MSEWFKEHAWKACVGETLPWVRIPLSPPDQAYGLAMQASSRTCEVCLDEARVAGAVGPPARSNHKRATARPAKASHASCEYINMRSMSRRNSEAAKRTAFRSLAKPQKAVQPEIDMAVRGAQGR